MNQFDVISVRTLPMYLNQSDTLIIDIRSREDYYEGHLPGAIHIPYQEEAAFYTLPKNKTIILLCERGSSSLKIAKEMARRGYYVKSIAGGAQACRASGLM